MEMLTWVCNSVEYFKYLLKSNTSEYSAEHTVQYSTAIYDITDNISLDSYLTAQSTLKSLRFTKYSSFSDDHVIEYAVYPNSGPLYTSRIVQHSINFNHPLLLHTSSHNDRSVPRSKPALKPARLVNKTSLRVSSEEVVVQAIKKV